MSESATGTLLLLIRHGEQQTLREPDPSLSDRGRLQALRLGERLAPFPVSRIVTSPLVRARQTAEALAHHHPVPLLEELDLEEVRVPEDYARHVFGGTTARSIEPDAADYAASSRASIDVVPRFTWGRVSGGETGSQLRARVVGALEALVAGSPGGVVACVSHGGAINAALGHWLGIERDVWFVPWHTGVSAVWCRGEDRTVLFVNDATHLDRGEDILTIVSAGMERGIA